LVTGIDLVAEQLRVASGEPLSFTQSSVAAGRRGHAIEVRINAENPAGGRFLPSPGRITRLVVPQGFGVRWDGGYETGDEVSQFYDNLVGKLVVWAGDRPTAIARMRRALSEMVVEGIATTIPAHEAILSHPDFASAAHSTKWVEERLDLSGVAAPGASAAAAAADTEGKVERAVDVEVDGRRYAVKVWLDAAVIAEGATGGSAAPAAGVAPARPRRSAQGGASGGAGSGNVTVPMQGTIVKVLVSAGDHVEVGQPVCVLEAMKMENNINAEKAGTVKEVKVVPGSQ
jgi:acetyl-CoA/propionyl-CoA carboxylase biotin carboxyl carrier protein